MKTELKGQVYEAVYLTDEEKVVIDALRAGAKAVVTFHDATFEQAELNTNGVPRHVLSKRYITDLTHGRIPFINVGAENKNGTIELNHFVKVKRKATAGTVTE
jgi:hypothetical protein